MSQMLLPSLCSLQPDIIFISAGFDAHYDDMCVHPFLIIAYCFLSSIKLLVAYLALTYPSQPNNWCCRAFAMLGTTF